MWKYDWKLIQLWWSSDLRSVLGFGCAIIKYVLPEREWRWTETLTTVESELLWIETQYSSSFLEESDVGIWESTSMWYLWFRTNLVNDNSRQSVDDRSILFQKPKQYQWVDESSLDRLDVRSVFWVSNQKTNPLYSHLDIRSVYDEYLSFP